MDEKVACAVNAFVGAILGAAIFMATLGGVRFLAGKSTAWWNGWPALFLCVAAGAVIGTISYLQRHREFEIPSEGPYAGSGGGWLLMRRIGVLLMGVVAVYFLWQLARGI